MQNKTGGLIQCLAHVSALHPASIRRMALSSDSTVLEAVITHHCSFLKACSAASAGTGHRLITTASFSLAAHATRKHFMFPPESRCSRGHRLASSEKHTLPPSSDPLVLPLPEKWYKAIMERMPNRRVRQVELWTSESNKTADAVPAHHQDGAACSPEHSEPASDVGPALGPPRGSVVGTEIPIQHTKAPWLLDYRRRRKKLLLDEKMFARLPGWVREVLNAGPILRSQEEIPPSRLAVLTKALKDHRARESLCNMEAKVLPAVLLGLARLEVHTELQPYAQRLVQLGLHRAFDTPTIPATQPQAEASKATRPVDHLDEKGLTILLDVMCATRASLPKNYFQELVPLLERMGPRLSSETVCSMLKMFELAQRRRFGMPFVSCSQPFLNAVLKRPRTMASRTLAATLAAVAVDVKYGLAPDPVLQRQRLTEELLARSDELDPTTTLTTLLALLRIGHTDRQTLDTFLHLAARGLDSMSDEDVGKLASCITETQTWPEGWPLQPVLARIHETLRRHVANQRLPEVATLLPVFVLAKSRLSADVDLGGVYPLVMSHYEGCSPVVAALLIKPLLELNLLPVGADGLAPLFRHALQKPKALPVTTLVSVANALNHQSTDWLQDVISTKQAGRVEQACEGKWRRLGPWGVYQIVKHTMRRLLHKASHPLSRASHAAITDYIAHRIDSAEAGRVDVAKDVMPLTWLSGYLLTHPEHKARVAGQSPPETLFHRAVQLAVEQYNAADKDSPHSALPLFAALYHHAHKRIRPSEAFAMALGEATQRGGLSTPDQARHYIGSVGRLGPPLRCPRELLLRVVAYVLNARHGETYQDNLQKLFAIKSAVIIMFDDASGLQELYREVAPWLAHLQQWLIQSQLPIQSGDVAILRYIGASFATLLPDSEPIVQQELLRRAKQQGSLASAPALADVEVPQWVQQVPGFRSASTGTAALEGVVPIDVQVVLDNGARLAMMAYRQAQHFSDLQSPLHSTAHRFLLLSRTGYKVLQLPKHLLRHSSHPSDTLAALLPKLGSLEHGEEVLCVT